MDGLLLVLSGLLLSCALTQMRGRVLRGLVSAYLSIMFCYGVANIANHFRFEQVVKRGWTMSQIPSVLEPRARIAWGIIVLSAAMLWGFGLKRNRRSLIDEATG